MIDKILGDYEWYRTLRGGNWRFIPKDKMTKEWRKQNEAKE